MPVLTPTVDDIKAAEPWKSGKYRAKVLSHEEKVSKPNKDTGVTSLNDWVVFQVIDGSDMDQRKIKHCFSEKFVLPAINFFRALGAKIEPGTSLQWEKTVDRELYILVGLEMYNSRPMAKVTDFLPLS